MTRCPRLPQTALVAVAALAGTAATADPVYLNQANTTVVVGAGTSAGSFNNTFDNGATIQKVIDAPSATATEFHDQQTHIWFTASQPGGGLELRFTFDVAYDINTLHFWNYTAESFDVDSVAFTFYDAANVQVGALTVMPALGSSPGITAQDITLDAPINVRYVTAFLTGSNQQVDFQNIGFTAEVSAVPEAGTLATMLAGLGLVGAAARRRVHG